MADPSWAEIGWRVGEVIAMATLAYKSARNGANSGAKDGVDSVYGEVVKNGHENLRSVCDRIEAKTDAQTMALLELQSASLRHEEELGEAQRQVSEVKRQVVENTHRISGLENAAKKAVQVVEDKLSDAKEVIVLKKEEGSE